MTAADVVPPNTSWLVELTIGLHWFGGGSLAENERRLISERTKAARAAKRAAGATLGNPRNITLAGEMGRSVQAASADEFVAGLLPIIQAIRSTGAVTLREHDRSAQSARHLIGDERAREVSCNKC